MAQSNQDNWTFTLTNMYFDSIAEPLVQEDYCFIACLSKLLRQSQSHTKRLWKKAEKVRKLGSWS